MKIPAAVGARPILEAFDAVWTPGAFKGADVRLTGWGDVAVTAFAIGADLEHAATIQSAIYFGAPVTRSRRQADRNKGKMNATDRWHNNATYRCDPQQCAPVSAA